MKTDTKALCSLIYKLLAYTHTWKIHYMKSRDFLKLCSCVGGTKNFHFVDAQCVGKIQLILLLFGVMCVFSFFIFCK